MPKERRKFDKEFKLMTVELSKNRDNYSELAEELGIRPELIYRWRREFLDKVVCETSAIFLAAASAVRSFPPTTMASADSWLIETESIPRPPRRSAGQVAHIPSSNSCDIY